MWTTFDWAKSFLAQRYIRVPFRNISSFKQQRQSMPQGAVLNYLLFNLFINDRPEAILAIPRE